MIKKTNLISLSLGVALLAGCATSKEADSSQTGNVRKDPISVTVLFTKPAKPYVELGTVSTLKLQPNPTQTWQGVLRNQAAAMGADAIIVDPGAPNNINTPVISGIAIRYSK